MNHDEHTKIILPYHEVHKAVLAVIDQDFVRNRVLWINYEQTISAQSSSLIVIDPSLMSPSLMDSLKLQLSTQKVYADGSRSHTGCLRHQMHK